MEVTAEINGAKGLLESRGDWGNEDEGDQRDVQRTWGKKMMEFGED